MKMRLYPTLYVVFAFLFFSSVAYSDNDTRDYVPLPPGTMLMAAYLNSISATDMYRNGDKVSGNANLDATIGIFRPVYYTQIGPFTVDPQALIIFGDQQLDGAAVGGVEMSSSGMADSILAATFWFINDPQSKTWMGFTPFITIPIGEYDRNSGLNLGANCWAFKGEIGFVKGFGKLFVDLTGNVEFYTDNEDYSAAGLTLSKDLLCTFETHLSYNFTESFFMGMDYFYHFGGETEVDGISSDDEKDDHALQAVFGFMLSPSFQLLVKYKKAFEVDNGLKTNTFGVRLAHFF
jgi:hypothetical protein